MKNLILIFTLLCSYSIAWAVTDTIYVDKNVSGGLNNGQDWTNAFSSLVAAMNTADSGMVLWISKGTYPTFDANSSVCTNVPIYIPDGVKLYGGFDGTEGPSFDLTNRNDSDSTIISGDATSLFTTSSASMAESIFDHIHFRATNTFITSDDALLHFESCSFTGISTSFDGFDFTQTMGLFYDCIFSDLNLTSVNSLFSGRDNQISVDRCHFKDIHLRNGKPFPASLADLTDSSQILLSNSIFLEVTSSAGVNVPFVNQDNSSVAKIINCSFDASSSDASDSTTHFDSLLIYNTIIHDTSLIEGASNSSQYFEISHSIVPPGYTGIGSSLLSADPLYVDNLLSISSSSTAIDAGDSTLKIGSIDFHGNARISDSTIDIGAHEKCISVCGSAKKDELRESSDLDSELSLSPNPTRDLVLVSSSEVIQRISVLSITGQTSIVRTYKSENTQVTLDVSVLASGVYLIAVEYSQGRSIQQLIVE